MLRVVDVRESHEEDDAKEENADKRSKPTEHFSFFKLALSSEQPKTILDVISKFKSSFIRLFS